MSSLRAPFAQVQVDDDQVALLKDGGQAFPSMLAAIAAAQRTICLETYIYLDDGTGRRFAEALMERARAGVDVAVMYDDWGSDLGDTLPQELERAGVRLCAFRPMRYQGSLGRMWARLRGRNHRKSLVVDGQVAFTGGLNVSNAYAAVEDGGEGWRDTHVRLEGPSARALQQLFLVTWRSQKGARLPDRFTVADPPPGRLRIVGNDFAAHRKDIRRSYLAALEGARQGIFLTHAYFLPPGRLLRALTRAARRGVRVAVVLGASTDVKLVLYAARALYPRLLKAGVEVYEWQGRILHAKTAVVDGAWATIGSSNLDTLSLKHNLEVNAEVRDAQFAGAVERLFLEDLSSCERVTLEAVREWSLLQRLVQWVALRFKAWL